MTMKKYLIFFTTLISQLTFAQQDCLPGNAQYYYPSGKIVQHLSTSGAFLNNSSGESGYNYLINDEPVSLIYTGGIWIAAVDNDGKPRFSGTTYVTNNNKSDWSPGPIPENGAAITASHCKNWDQFFVVDREDFLTAVELMYNSNGSINKDNCDKLPKSILGWPGRSNPHFESVHGFNLPDHTVASFFDNDGDGRYDPCSGDLPMLDPYGAQINTFEDVVATFPDRLSLNILNDRGSDNTLSFGLPLGIEIYQVAFDYHSQDSLETTTFYQHKLVYKGAETLNDSRFSLWFDPDMGCYLDDFVGTSSTHNMIYFYNTDAVDGMPADFCNGVSTFGSEIPITGISYLDGLDYIDFAVDSGVWVRSGLTSSLYLNNCSVGSVEPVTCDPDGQDSSFYYKMIGKWAANVPVTIGGNGYNPGSTDTTNYVFDANPADVLGWSMCTANMPPSDLRMLMSTGSGPLLPGAIDEVMTAIQTAPNVSHPCPDIQPLIDLNKAANNFKRRGWRRASTTASTNPNFEKNLPWSFEHNEGGFKLTTHDTNVKIIISDINGRVLERYQMSRNETLGWTSTHLINQLYIIHISNEKQSQAYKYFSR